MNEKILEECSVKVYKIDSYFYEHYKEKIQVDKNGREYILFRINVCFTEYLLAVEIDEKKTCRKRPNLLELMQLSVMMKIMKLVEYKHLSLNLKTDN